MATAERRRPSWWPAVRAAARARPGLALAVVVLTLVSAAVPAAFIGLSGAAAGLLSDPGAAVSARLGLVVTGLAVLLALSQIAGSIRADVLDALAWQMDKVLRRRLIEAIARPAGVGHLEDARMQYRIAIGQGVANRLAGPVGGLLGLAGRAQVGLAASACAALLAWVQPILAVVLALVNVVVGWWLRREYYSLVEHLHLDPGVLRRTQYLRDVLLAPGAEKETRVFGLGRWFMDLHHAEWLRVASAAGRGRRIGWWKIVIGAAVLGAGQATTFAVLAAGWQDGSVTIAGLVVGVQASIGLLQFAAVTEWDELAKIGWESVDALGDVEDEVRPLAPGPGRDPGPAPQRQIDLRDVAFAYPDGTRVLHGVSFSIAAGGSLAIVGRNGAGKSTLLKLLLRSYEPSAGEIVVDGTPLAALDPALWRTRVATMAQDFVRLPLSIRENITGPGGAVDEPALAEAAERSGVDSVVAGLPRGWTPSCPGRSRAARICPAANGRRSPWPAACTPCVPGRGCWPWTNRPRVLTSNPNEPCMTRSSTRPGTVRCSWSRTGSRRSAAWTTSWCSTRAASSSPATTRR